MKTIETGAATQDSRKAKNPDMNLLESLPRISKEYIDSFREIRGYCRLISRAEVENGINPPPSVLGEGKPPTTFPLRLIRWAQTVQESGLASVNTICAKALDLGHTAAQGTNETRAALYDILELQIMLLSTPIRQVTKSS